MYTKKTSERITHAEKEASAASKTHSRNRGERITHTEKEASESHRRKERKKRDKLQACIQNTESQAMPICANHRPSLSIRAIAYHLMPSLSFWAFYAIPCPAVSIRAIRANLCQSMSIRANPCQSMSIHANPCQSMPILCQLGANFSFRHKFANLPILSNPCQSGANRPIQCQSANPVPILCHFREPFVPLT